MIGQTDRQRLQSYIDIYICIYRLDTLILNVGLQLKVYWAG